MATCDFDEFFRRPELGRGEFLSRLFGIFSEQVTRHWCRCPESSYEDLGRPTLRETGTQKPWYTLDFTLRSRDTNQIFMAEMKCWLQYQGFSFLRLINAGQLTHNQPTAFQWFLRLAREPSVFDVRVANKPVAIDGAVLIWSAITPEGRDAVMTEFGIADVLSVEAMVRDLQVWRPANWIEFVSQRRRWCNELFDVLAQ